MVLPASAYGGFGGVAELAALRRPGRGAARRRLVDGDVRLGATWLVLAVWAVVGTVLTARTFKWE